LTNLIISFCEGRHDIAFLSRILNISGFKSYGKKLKNFPSPLNKQYEKELMSKNISDSKLGFQTNYKVPADALYKGDTLALFHDLGGDGKIAERKEILSMYQKLIGKSEEDEFSSKFDMSFRFIYFFDADNIGIKPRVDALNNELGLSINIEHDKILKIDGYEWGCYIFHKDENGGDLEDILVDLMTKDNESIFKSCTKYLSTNLISDERRKEYICTEECESYKSSSKFKIKKSLISVAGQLQFSGMSNAVIISNSDYIKKNDLEENIHCVNIKNLFSY